MMMNNVVLAGCWPHCCFQSVILLPVCLLNGDVGGLRDVHLWTHWTAASLDVDGLHTGQGWAANRGAQGLALQAVAMRAAVDVPPLLVGIRLSIEMAHHLLWYRIFYAIWAALPLSQDRPLAGDKGAGLRVAADGAIHAHAARADVGLPGLCCQEDVTVLVLAVAWHAVIG